MATTPDGDVSTAEETASTNSETVSNRSEIVFLYDAVDANPNGNPLSGANRPRIDPQTQQAIVTDVRLKRYLRDQLADDGDGVYIRNVRGDEGYAQTREALLEACVKDTLEHIDEVGLDEVEDEELVDKAFGEFLEKSADVRYFGATMSIDASEALGKVEDALPNHFTGPVQFSPGKTLHAVNENEGYNSLTSVIATQERKEQGGFGLDDHRIQYGLIAFHGLVDEHGAIDTRLTDEDVSRLDTLCWRAIKNQTVTRSKVGQEPRLYLRVEYDGESYHVGGLAHDLSLDEENSKPEDELRTVRDLSLDVTELVDRLDEANRIDTVHVVASDVLDITYNGQNGGPELLYEELQNAVGDGAVDEIDVYEDSPATPTDATE